MIELTDEERALDIQGIYDETDVAIQILKNVPREAIEMRTILRRCIVAEELLKISAASAGETEPPKSAYQRGYEQGLFSLRYQLGQQDAGRYLANAETGEEHPLKEPAA